MGKWPRCRRHELVTNAAKKWVHKSFKRAEGPAANPTEGRYAVKKRLAVPHFFNFVNKDSHQNTCGESTFTDETSADAPFTGGCESIRDWHAANMGLYEVSYRDVPSPGMHKILMASGSNGGANCYFGVRHDAIKGVVGNTDVADVIDVALRSFMKPFDGRWRLRAIGVMPCQSAWIDGGDAAVSWKIGVFGSNV